MQFLFDFLRSLRTPGGLQESSSDGRTAGEILRPNSRVSCLRHALWSATAVTLVSCGSLPSSGPSISMIEGGAKTDTRPGDYIFVPVTQSIVDSMRQAKSEPLPPAAIPAPSAPTDATSGIPLHTTGMELVRNSNIQKISAGDVIGVSIYTSGGGLFGPSQTSGNAEEAGTSQNSATRLPPQMVDDSGAITVPHAGQIPVIGRTPHEVENEITEALKGKAFMPDVIVTMDERRGSDLVTVTGDVGFPKRIAVPMSGLRIVDAITSAGGVTGKDFETNITILRGMTQYTENYREIEEDPAKNAFLQADDTLLVKYKPWTFTSLGATGQTQHLFATEEISAEEAMASVNGLDDNKANPEAFFIYRFESPAALSRLGLQQEPVTAAGVPVIYQINIRAPGGLFLAKQFAIRDKDVILVGNAGAVGVLKVLTVVGALAAPAATGLAGAAGVETLKP